MVVPVSNSSENGHGGVYLLCLLVVFVAWEFLSHLLMHRMEMASYHVLSVIVETALATAMMMLAVRFLSRQKRLLERQIALRETMTQMLVHDLRNPLSGLLIAFRTLQRHPSAEVVDETIDLGIDSATRIKDLIDDILDIARLEELSNALDIEVNDQIGSSLKAVADFVTRVAKDKQINTEIVLPLEIPPMPVDLRRFRRVLENLLGNAIKHTPARGLIRLEIALDSEQLKVEVSDNGPGIPPKDRERIFEKFEMIGRSSRSASGLGLTFCRLVVEGHGGQIWVDESPEGGCSFKFRIPLKPQDE